MSCGKTWELLMNQLDGEIEGQDLMRLENHLRLCPECRRQYDSLHLALRELDAAKPVAPDCTERKVMEKLYGARRKETAPLLPYVVLPAAMLTGVLTLLLYKLYLAGPMVLVDKVTRALMVFYKVFQSIIAVSHYLLNVLYLREILIGTGFALLAGIVFFLFKRLERAGSSEAYWRVTK